MLHVDDLQWAEPMLLDLLEHVVELSRDGPILVLCTARLELLEERPSWGREMRRAKTLVLEPLALAECEELLAELNDALEPHVRARVIAASDGNPLFLQELVELARELGTVVIPPTIQALLTARLEALIAQERELLGRGSVEGHVFHRSAVGALSTELAAQRLESDLAGLVRKDLIRPHPASVPGDDAFRFRHLLIRDAAYERLTKATRADLHERFAQWLIQTLRDVPELDEIAGWHLEQAVLYRRELSFAVTLRVAYTAAAGARASAATSRLRETCWNGRRALRRETP
jgi:predicted ATPase